MANAEISSRRKCCIHCHFLVAEREVATGVCVPDLELTREERTSLLTSDDPVRKVHLKRLYCYRGVWDSSLCPDDELWEEHIDAIPHALREDCGETCFFYEYAYSLALEAAEELERRQAGRREAKRDRKWAKIGVWVAAIALLLNLAWSVYQHYSSPRIVPEKAGLSETQRDPPAAP